MRKKIIALVVCLLLIAVAAIGSSLAYFTDKEEATNTFTVGKVDIELTEPNWNPQDSKIMPGIEIPKDPTIAVVEGTEDCWVFLKLDMNKYVSLVNLMGVHAYKTGVAGLSGEYPGLGVFLSYLRDNRTAREQVIDGWFHGIDHAKWQVMNLDAIEAAIAAAAEGTNSKKIPVVLGYKDVQHANDTVKFMDSFTMPGTVTQSMLDGEDAYYVGEGDNRHSASNFNTTAAKWKMKVTAYAIQAAGFETLDDAYTALKGETDIG